MKETIGILVKNHPGVLSRIAGLFTRRGYNIASIAAGVTEDPKYTRITIVAEGNKRTLDQIVHQLNKQLDVIKVIVLGRDESVRRELALIKIEVKSSMERLEIIEIANTFRANVVDIGKKMITTEVTGPTEKINAFISLMSEFGIKEIARTGKIALSRGPMSIREEKEDIKWEE